MSILVVQVLPRGMIFGADRNITSLRMASDPSGQAITLILGQSQRQKVLKWPNKRALIGYVGAAQIAGIHTDEWLYQYIGENLEFTAFEDLAKDLSAKIEAQRAIDEGEGEPEALVIHLGGFGKREGHQVPVVWYIRNPYDIKDGYYCDIRKAFQCTEEFWEYFPNVSPAQIRHRLDERAKANQPFWFHQGIDLGTFNALEAFLRGALALLCKVHPQHTFPQKLADWEKHLKMSILTYTAYYQAFKGPGEQYVGGGVDTVTLEWPK